VCEREAVVIEVFTDQAYNLILLAEDEARMLGRPMVETEHLLLALARRGNVGSLLERRGLTASDIHAAIVRAGGLGEELVLGPVPRSAETDAALARAIGAAADRGVLGPSTEHVLLGLSDDPAASRILREVGIEDPVALVNEVYPPRRGPLPAEAVRRYAARLAIVHEPPQPGPIAPVFERFTAQARATVLAADRSAEDVYIEPFHLLLGLLQVADGVAAKALAAHEVTPARARSRTGNDRPSPSPFRRFPPRGYPPPREDEIFGIFTAATRQVLSEESLRRAHTHGDAAIGTGHLLLGLIDVDDANVSAALGGPEAAQGICATVVDLLPGDEVTSVG
jgi:ATP-dependent Clp protease ATP-binding subunit ClpA